MIGATSSEREGAVVVYLSLEEIVRVLAWANEHQEALKRHVSWLKDTKNNILPGAEIVIAEVQKDIGINYGLMTKFYEHRNALQKDGFSPETGTGTGATGGSDGLR